MADDIHAQGRRAWDALQAGDYPESARLYERLAEVLGDETAFLNLGWMYQQGHLGAPDIEKAISLFEKAAEAGGAEAKYYLGWALRKKGDLRRARSVFLEGAEQGSTECMCWAGVMLVRAEGGDAGIVAGVAWLRRAADAGDTFARSELQHEEEMRAWEALQACDYVKGARLLEPLAARGSEYALLRLGCLHRDGRLGPPDLDRAISFFEKAARGGGAHAKHHLGWAWRKKGEMQRARAIFLEGAQQGYTPCMYWAGRMMMRGEGGDADLHGGVAWLTRGADAGHVFCRRALLGLELRNTRSFTGRLAVRYRIVRYVFGLLRRYARDPYSVDFR